MSSAPAPADPTTPTTPTSPTAKSRTDALSEASPLTGTKRSRADMENNELAAAEALSLSNSNSNSNRASGEDGGWDKKKTKKERKERREKNEAGAGASSTNDDDDGGGEWQTIRNGRPTKKLKKLPRKDSGNYPSLTFNKNARLQNKIQVSDLRNLVTYLFADGTAPQWLAVHHRPHFRKVVVILVPGLEEAMLKAGVDFARWMEEEDGSTAALERWIKKGAKPSDDCYPRTLDKDRLPAAAQPLADVFPQFWPVRARGNEKYATMFSPVATFLTAPLPKSAEEKAVKGPRFQGSSSLNPHQKDVRTRISEFIATPQEYLSNDFVLHPALLPTAEQRAAFRDEPGWVHTGVAALSDGDVPEAEIEQGSITAGRKVYAVDCEMCKAAGDKFVLTRISVVAWDGEVVLDELVKPDEPIVDYLTQFSGITEAMLAPVTTSLRDIQARLLALLDARSVLVGHSLDSDVRAMQLTHPFVVDTSIAFPHPMTPTKKHALRWLATKYLNRAIQKGHGTARGHDSVEDARTCLDLIKRKCEKGKAWGGSSSQNAEWAGGEGAGENLFHRLARAGTAYRSQGGPPATGGVASGKSTASVDWGDARRTLCGEAAVVLGGCRSDADVEAGVVRAVTGDADGKVVPGGGVDFVWARMRELEALQGWWNRNKLASAGGSDAQQPNNSSGQGPPSLEMLEALMAVEEDKYPEETGEDEEEGKEGKEDEEAGADAEARSPLERAVRILARRLRRIHAQLPPCTALVVFSGSGDPRAMSRLQAQRAQHKKEYHTPGVKWDEISVPWTDTEMQLLQQAVRRAREGIAFITVK